MQARPEIGMFRIDDGRFPKHPIRVHLAKERIGGGRPLRPNEVKALKGYLRNRQSIALALPNDSRHARRPQAPGRADEALLWSENGADIMFVNDWHGHAQIANTMIYAKLTSKARDSRAHEVFRGMPSYA